MVNLGPYFELNGPIIQWYVVLLYFYLLIWVNKPELEIGWPAKITDQGSKICESSGHLQGWACESCKAKILKQQELSILQQKQSILQKELSSAQWKIVDFTAKRNIITKSYQWKILISPSYHL